MPVAHRRLSDAQREEVRTRVLAGERQVDLAREFGVTRAYVSLIRQQALHPERYQEPRRELKIKLLSRELEELLKVVAATRPTGVISKIEKAARPDACATPSTRMLVDVPISVQVPPRMAA